MPTLDWERKAGFPNRQVAGVDEVGRGCLAGPVVAAAVILPPQVDQDFPERVAPELLKITDSKALTAPKREKLEPLIQAWVAGYSIGIASVEEIDRLNIYHATHLAMVRAVQGLALRPAHILVDGNVIPKNLPCSATAIVKGDLKCLSIAAASILAKVWRDRHMSELDARYPGFGFAVHKGYGTPAHIAALKKLGICEIHRKSFAPVAEAAGLGQASLF